MGEEKVKMHQISDLTGTYRNGNKFGNNGQETNAERPHKFENLPSPRKSESIGKVKCLGHGEEMVKSGTSSRGISEYFCEHGCKAEIGVGRVKKVINDDGYGFLVMLDSREELFFHFSNVEDFESIKRGDLFTFRVGYNHHSNKLQAVRLQPLQNLRRVDDERN